MKTTEDINLFAIGITHELKSPLAAIEGAIERLEEKFQGRMDYLSIIHRNASRLRRTVDDLLMVLGTESHRPRLYCEEMDFVSLCREVMDAYRPIAEERRLSLILEAPPVPLWIEGDREKIVQVISNLLSNAVRFTPSGNVTLRIQEQFQNLEICVEDTGIGIPSHEIPHVFNRFFQGREGRLLKGSGLGLTITKAWVEAHGGGIRVDSNGPGCGSRFSFTLPFRRDVALAM